MDRADHPARDPAGPGDRGDGYRLLALAALTAGLIGLCVALAVPFLPALTWGVALAIMAWPLHVWVSRRLGRPGGAATISTAFVVAVLLIPGLFVSYQLAREAAATAERTQGSSGLGSLHEKVAEVPALGPAVTWMDQTGIDLETEARKVIGQYTQDVTVLAQGSVAAVVQFLVMVFVLFYLFRDRRTFQNGVRDLMPLPRAESDRVFERAADSVHANLYATVVTSLIDAVSAGLLFWFLDLPAPFLWGVVIFVLSVLPVLGSGLVWVPTVAYLALSDRWLAALALTAWGVVTAIFVDNLLFVRLVGGRLRMHPVPALIAFLGGLALFGMSGIILGPAIFAITGAILDVWLHRQPAGDAPSDT